MTPISKEPPQAPEIEEGVLGALLLERDAYLEVENILSSEVFYKDAHQLIYGAIQSLHKRNDPVDLLTVSNELNTTGDLENAGGRYYISTLASKMSSAANIQTHALIVFEMYLKRQVIVRASEAIKEAYDPGSDALDLIAKFNSQTEALADVSCVNDEIKDLSDNLILSLQHIENTKQHGGISGVATGYPILDKITAGWQPEEFVILAGRPGMGKSAAVLQFALNAAESGVPVAFFSLEMSTLQLTKRMQSNYSEIPSDKIKVNNLSPDDWGILNEASSKLSRYKIKIDDTPSLTVRALKSKCRKLKRKGQLGLIIVDYVQLMDGTEATGKKGGLREQEIAYISRSLKNLAKELKVSVLGLSQLSRDVEKRGGAKEPNLADLRESGALEQDADIVIFIHRPEYYGIMETEDGSSTAGMAQFIFAKYRDGSPTRASLRFIPSISKFATWESEPVHHQPSPHFAEPPEKEVAIGQDLSMFATDDQPF